MSRTTRFAFLWIGIFGVSCAEMAPSSDATGVEPLVELAASLARPDPALSAALDPERCEPEGFVFEGERIVSPGERRLRRDPVPALVIDAPASADGSFALSRGGAPELGVRVRFASATSSPREIAGGLAVYREIAASTDTLVRARETSMQVLYLLHDASAPRSFSWELTLGERLATIEARGRALAAVDAHGETVLEMPDGVAYDADGGAYPVRARWDAGTRTVTWSIDGEPARFPVLVDPIVNVPLWQESALASGLNRNYAAMAYDAARGEIVMFGGENVAGARADTWTWDGARWTQRSPAVSPPARVGAAMAYDAARSEIVLFGGSTRSGGARLGDTWVWDGSSWNERSPGTSPPARELSAMAFDAARAEIVLFGGYGSGNLADTWTWDGTDWTEEIVSGPTGRHASAMAYDALHGEVVLFGGLVAGARNDTWTWDGTAWTNETPATSPPGTSFHGIAYDVLGAEVVLFAGGGTWTWDGVDWTNEAPAPAALSGRTAYSMAYDAASSDVLVFGGRSPDGTYHSDAWAWNGSSWRVAWLEGTPEGREQHAMAYDSVRHETVMFGWAAGTWTWNGTVWIEEAPATSPSARFGTAMAFDAARGEVVLFGGSYTDFLDDTWTWDGTDWRLESPADSPTPRRDHAMAYDAARGEVVLFGGANASDSTANETWTWDGTNWTQETPATVPPSRGDHAMAYGAARDQIVMFGGSWLSTRHQDTWTWDGANWTEHIMPLSPSGRAAHAMAWHEDGQFVALFGGRSNLGLMSDTWGWDGSAWIALSGSGPMSAREDHAMAADARGDIVLFGGDDGGILTLADTWLFVAQRGRGRECLTSEDCTSGHCVEGVCCSSACGEGSTTDCMSCLNSLTGLPDGTCGALDSAAAPLVVCRPVAGGCDVEERCRAGDLACPGDAFAARDTSCRDAVGPCDVAESCSGISRDCPADAARAPGAPCGDPPSGVCDAQDVCEGTVGATASCAGRFQPSTMECGAASCVDGLATAAVFCDGASPGCPTAEATSCGAYACDGDECFESCAGDADCATGHYCDGTTCITQRGEGEACTADRECAGGACMEGICCAALPCGPPDAGIVGDAGSIGDDAGAIADAGSAHDAAVTAADASTGADAGAGGGDHGGCGCSAPGGGRSPGWLTAIVLALAASSRRRARRSRVS